MPALLAVHSISPFGQRRFGTVAVVGALHVAAIYALLVSLDVVPSPIRPTPPVSVHFIDKTQPKPLPPVTPDDGVVLVHPKIPIPPNQPTIDTTTDTNLPAADHPLSPTGSVVVSPSGGPTLSVRALAATHTIPPYPPLGIRLAHEGTAKLRITVDEQGNVVSADLVQSSGHEELDAAAVAWVKAHWRYQPAMQDGHAVSATTNAVVTFRLDQVHG